MINKYLNGNYRDPRRDYFDDITTGEKLNSVDIAKQYEGSLCKSISIPAIHVVLKRMEKKGWVKSEFGSPTAERGGRRKKSLLGNISGI